MHLTKPSLHHLVEQRNSHPGPEMVQGALRDGPKMLSETLSPDWGGPCVGVTTVFSYVSFIRTLHTQVA